MSSQYEFNDKENQIIGTLAQLLKIVGILFIINGVFAFMDYIMGEALSNLMAGEITEIHQFVINIIFVIIGITLFRPTDNLKRIVTTQGNDIQELMTALKELNSGFNIIVYLFVILVIMEFIVLFI